MEEFHHQLLSKLSTSTTFSQKTASRSSNVVNDVFGSPLDFQVSSFPSLIDDYSEMFSSFHALKSSASVPVLHFRLFDCNDISVDVLSSNFNYAEVFGGFDGVDFANYEEIIAENLSDGPRISAEMDCTQQASAFVSGTPSEGHNGDPFNCSEENDILSNEIFDLTCDDVGQLHVPLNMANGKSKGDSIDGTSPTAEFHEVSVSDFVVDACASSKEIKYGRHPPQVTNDLNLSEEPNRGIAEGEHFRETLSNATVCSSITKISGNDLEADMEQLGDNYTTLGDVPASDQNCGHYLYNRSSSKVFLTVSDINLQTRPCQVPPPLRPPPNLVTKQNDLKGIIIADAKAYPGKVHLCKGSPIDQTCRIGMASEKHAVEEAAKESSPPFFDVEIDSGSAAMKEVMEKGQTRLKSAKESIERKQDNAKSLVKLGLNEHKIGQERKVSATAPHDYKYMEDITLETREREKCEMKYVAADERQMTIGAVHGVLNFEEKWGYIELATDSMVKRHGKECRTMLECCKQEGSGDDWEADKPFYELVKDEKFKVAQDFPVRDHKQKLAEITEPHGEELNKKKVAEQVCVPEKNGRSRVVQEFRGWEENVEELKEAQKLEENIKQPVTDLVACVSKENKKKVEVAYEREEKESRAAKRFCKCEEDDQILKAAKATSERQVKKKIEDAQMAYKMEENEKEMRAAEEACQFALNEKELKATKEPFEQDKIKKISEIAPVKVRSGAYETVCDVNVKLKAAKDASNYEENKKAMKAAKGASKYEGCEMTMKAAKKVSECYDDDKKFKEVANKQSGNSETLKKTEDFCHWEENKKKLEAADGAHGCKKNEEKMEMSGYVLVQDTYDEKLGVVQEARGWENNKKELKVSQKSAEVKMENHLETADTACEIGGNQKNIRDDLVVLDQLFIKTKFKAAQEIFRWLEVGKKSEAARWEKVLEGVHILGTAPDVLLDQGKEKKEETGYVMNEIEEKKNEKVLLTESEMHKEQVRKFGEEREKEHKRVKDRITVETHVIHDGAFAEVRERAERIHMESMTAEANPRAMEYNQGSAEMVSAKAHKKFLAEKASVQSTLRAEHEAMARADSEARKRAAENSLLDNLGASGWMERSVAEKFTARKDNGIECFGDETDFGIKQSSSSSVNDVQNFAHDRETLSVNSSSINSLKYSKSEDWSASHSDVKFQGADGESAKRCEARLARHQRMLERMAKALAEKNLRDILAQRELAERNRLAEALDADVRRWSKGKEGNLRALLSTLQYILGPENGWQPIPLTDVITAVAVKKAYKKAALYVHPDKVQQRRASIQQKYICEKVYDLLKEAWNKFNSEEP